MQYALLIYQTPERQHANLDADNDELWAPWRAYHQALLDAGVFVAGDALHPASTATTVRMKDGRREVQDGPYADTKELLAGFVTLELPSLDAALEWAARCPAASNGAVEIRPVAEYLRARLESDIRAGRVTRDG